MHKFICGFFIFSLISTGIWAQQSNADLVGKNVVRLSPLTLFYGGAGASFSYERFIDEEQKISVHLPVSVGARTYYVGSDFYSQPIEGQPKQNVSVAFCPGVRFYPKSIQGKSLKYAIGASILTTYGTENGFKEMVPNTNLSVFSNGTEIRLGTLISNSLTLKLNSKWNIGGEVMLGYSVYSRFSNDQSKIVKVGKALPMGLVALQIGYAF